MPVDLSLHSNSTVFCKLILHGVSSGLEGRSNSLSLCLGSVCFKVVITVSCPSVSGGLSAQVQCSAVGLLNVVLHLNKEARPELALLGLLYGETPALLLGSVCICQGHWLPAIHAGLWLPGGHTHSYLPLQEMCHPWTLESAELRAAVNWGSTFDTSSHHKSLHHRGASTMPRCHQTFSTFSLVLGRKKG